MAHITLQNPAQPVADFSVIGTTITIAGTVIDAAALQSDSQVLINVAKDKTGAVKLNPKNGGTCIAIVRIPAKQYQDIPAVDAAGAPILDMNGKPTTNHVAIALDANTVSIELWPTV